MKITHVLSASVIAGALLFSTTACSPSDDAANKPTTAPTVSASASPSITATHEPGSVAVTPLPTVDISSTATADVSADADVEDIVSTVSGYYKFVSSPGSLDKVQAAGSALSPKPTDEELTQFASNFSEGFKYFDTSSSENITNAHNQLFARATQSSRKPGATVNVPAEAVTVTGDTATVDATKVIVTLNGQAGPSTMTPYFEHAQLALVKDASGSWVIIAEAPRQAIP